MTKKCGLSRPAQHALAGVLLLLSLTACGHHNGSSGTVSSGQAPAVAANTLRVHYHRSDGAYSGWGIYSWAGPTNASPVWPTPNFPFASTDADGWGEYVDIPIASNATSMSFLVVNPAGGGTKDTPGNLTATFGSLANAGSNIWILSGNPTVYTAEPPANLMPTFNAQAIWLTPDTLVWPGASGASYKLYLASAGGISSDATGVTGAASSYDLTSTTLSADLKAKFPQYATCVALTVPTGVNCQTALKGQVVVASFDATGKLATGTSVQTAPLLDQLYATAAAATPLGLSFANGVPTFALWAPTATAVTLNVYSSATGTGTPYPMVYAPATGIWSFTAPDATWTNKAYYDFNVTVFSRMANNQVVTNQVQDPYSVSLSANSAHSMVVNLADPATAPQGWPGTLPATAASPTDAVIYELHMRDFSAYNSGAYQANAGKYLAFTEPGNPGMTHLAALAQAGLTHIHLLPSFEFATVDEALDSNIDASIPASSGADTAAESYMINAGSNGQAPQNVDLFNWGYDPWFYGAPEGSYSSNAGDGLARVLEFRKMVQALHGINLRVIMDVVYNHSAAAGQDPHACLDRVVPGYYNRLDSNGNFATYAGAGADIAVENAMMARLMTDTLVRWAGQYKVDGFRFDEMGLLPVPAMVAAQGAVNAVAQADGRGATYFYGEGWNSATLPFLQAIQKNMAGTGIGTFNDRMRDSVRGGGPFDSAGAIVTNQGFGSGLGYDPNTGTAAAQAHSAQAAQNLLEVSLAGNLAAFPLNGATLGGALNYGGQSAGYALEPQENLAYVSCHDNETLWDISQYKHPQSTSASDRARAQVVDLSTVLLAHGVAFIQAGDDLLRSKSDDSNSYNSGDYFNRIHWDGSSNNWAVGAPPQNTGNNAANLAQEQAALGNGNAAVTAGEIAASTSAFQDFLKVRKSSNLFRLPDAASVIAHVRFPDQGLGQMPGVVVMQVGDGTSAVGDQAFASALTVFNASNTAQTITYPWYAGRQVSLHPALASGSDAVTASATFNAATGTFQVPARSTAVFVESANNAFTANNATMYVRGSWTSSWDLTSPMKRVAPNTWQASVQLQASSTPYSFKFDTGTWSTSWGGSQGLAASNGGNISLNAPATGNYVIQFNDQTLAYRVMPPVWFPGAPTGLSASTSATTATLTWTNSGGSFYNVYRSLDGITWPATPIGTAVDGGSGYTDTGLTTGTTYYYQVSASNGMFTSGRSATCTAIPEAGGAATWIYPTMAINGSWSGWATTGSNAAGVMTHAATAHVWTVTLAITAAELAIPTPSGTLQFKFDTDNNWGNTSGPVWGSNSASSGLTGTAVLSGSGNITVPLSAPGNYTITFNEATLAYTITQN